MVDDQKRRGEGSKRTRVPLDDVDLKLARSFDADFISKHNLLPYKREALTIRVAVSRPVDPAVLFEIENQTSCTTRQVLVSEANLFELIKAVGGRKLDGKRSRRLTFREPVAYAVLPPEGEEEPPAEDGEGEAPKRKFHLGKCLDISESGILFQIEEVPRGLRVKGRILLRVHIGSEGMKMLDLPAGVVRIVGDEEGMFQVAARYADVSPEDLRLLRLRLISLQMPGGRG